MGAEAGSELAPQYPTVDTSRAGRRVQVGQGESAYRAFVPHPLPPELVWSPSLITLLADAERALGELSGLGRALPNPYLFVQPFVRREAVLSSRIEGTQSDLTHLYAYEGQLLLPEFLPSVRPEDTREVLNYVYALEYGLERLQTLPLSLRLIREVHERLMEGVRGGEVQPGQFRRSQNWIGSPGCPLQEATFVPPPPALLDKALYELEEYLHAPNPLPLLVRLALIHYQFEAIHPLVDGNGRVGRLLIILLMVHWNLLPSPLLYLSAFFERRRESYYLHLLEVSTKGDWEAWVAFFLQGVREQSRDSVLRIQRLQSKLSEWREQLVSRRASSKAIPLLETLLERPYLTIPQIAQRLSVTYPTARSMVELFVSLGILEPVGSRTYGKVYQAKAILELLQIPTLSEAN